MLAPSFASSVLGNDSRSRVLENQIPEAQTMRKCTPRSSSASSLFRPSFGRAGVSTHTTGVATLRNYASQSQSLARTFSLQTLSKGKKSLSKRCLSLEATKRDIPRSSTRTYTTQKENNTVWKLTMIWINPRPRLSLSWKSKQATDPMPSPLRSLLEQQMAFYWTNTTGQTSRNHLMPAFELT